MGIVDLILNLAGLLLWIDWRTAKVDPLGKRRPATLIGTLRRVESKSWSWQLPCFIAGLILLRALSYWQIGSVAKPVWAGALNLGAVEISFRSDAFSRMLLFSILSFGLMLAIFYLWMLFLSLLAGPEPIHGLIRAQLGRVDRWSRGLKIVLPLIVAALLWWLLSWPLSWLAAGDSSNTHYIPQSISQAHRIESAFLVGLGSYLVWKFPIALLLVLRLLNSYIYFGKHPFWNYVNSTAQTLLQPLHAGLRALTVFLPRSSPLRTGKMNFSPALKITLTSLLNVAGIALVFFLAELAERLLVYGCERLSV